MIPTTNLDHPSYAPSDNEPFMSPRQLTYFRNKINEAIRRIDEGSYGYCEVTGEPIGLKRLEARPIATLSLEAQEHHEKRERICREEFI